MGNIQIPRIQRKTKDVAPRLTEKASAGALTAPFTGEVQDLARATGELGQAVGAVAGDIVERVGTHKKKKRQEKLNNSYLDTASQGEQLFQEFQTREALEGEDLVAEYTNEFEKIIGDAVVKQGLDAEGEAQLRERLIPNRLMWRRGIAKQTVVDREVALATYQSELLGQNTNYIRVDPTPERLDFSIQQMHIAIDEGGGKEANRKKAKQLAEQSLTETYLDSIGPNEALESLDSRALGYGAAFKDTKSRDAFRRMLERKAKAQETSAENARKAEVEKVEADLLTSLQNGESVDETAIYKNPAIKDDPKAIKSIQRIIKNYSKEIKQEQRDREYDDIMNDPNLPTYTNPEINERVTNTDDAIKAIKWRDNVLKNPSVAGQTYNEVLKSFKADHSKKGGRKFGTGPEGDAEYMRQQRAFQEWALANPDKDPVEYYERIMAPINAGYFSRAFQAGPIDALFGEGGVPDPQAARLREDWVNANRTANPNLTDAELRGVYDRGTQWVDDNRTANPDYTDAELREYYDQKVMAQ
jgi:hypothetical protein